MITFGRLEDLENADQVAAVLLEEKAYGYPFKARECPLAVYLQKVNRAGIVVGPSSAWAADGNRALTEAMGEFEFQFDRGGFAELMKEITSPSA